MSGQIHYQIIATDYGAAALAWTDRGIVRMLLPAPDPRGVEEALLRRIPSAERADVVDDQQIVSAILSIQAYFAGADVDFGGVPVSSELMSGEDGPIYAHVRELGYGETSTYGTIATMLDLGAAGARRVGQAMARNPVPLIIPCHRVLAAGGALGGFSGSGGTDTKRHMLEMEGVALAPPKPVQQDFGF